MTAARSRLVARAALILWAVLLWLGVAVAIDLARSDGIHTWLARLGIHPAYEAKGRRVDVDGAGVYLDCRGAGSPTVILEQGYGGGADGWSYVLDGIAETTRVCAWDRPGIGRSAARPLHSAGETARILREALRTAAESGPFVVVAHSLGGVYARLFADQSGEVRAFVMLDTFEPDLGMDRDPLLPADQRAEVAKNIADTGVAIQAGESLDFAATMAELSALGTVEQGGFMLWVDPYVRFHDDGPGRQQAMIDAWYRGVRARYPNLTLEVVPNTGHTIQLERPDVVVARVRQVVLGLRTP